jgi:hypothetical protein
MVIDDGPALQLRAVRMLSRPVAEWDSYKSALKDDLTPNILYDGVARCAGIVNRGGYQISRGQLTWTGPLHPLYWSRPVPAITTKHIDYQPIDMLYSIKYAGPRPSSCGCQKARRISHV